MTRTNQQLERSATTLADSSDSRQRGVEQAALRPGWGPDADGGAWLCREASAVAMTAQAPGARAPERNEV